MVHRTQPSFRALCRHTTHRLRQRRRESVCQSFRFRRDVGQRHHMESWQKLANSGAGGRRGGSGACGTYKAYHVSRARLRFGTITAVVCALGVVLRRTPPRGYPLHANCAFAHARHSHDSKMTPLSVGFGSNGRQAGQRAARVLGMPGSWLQKARESALEEKNS